MKLTTPGFARPVGPDFQRCQDPEEGARNVDEDGLVEAGREVRGVGVPGHVQVPQLVGTEAALAGSHFRQLSLFYYFLKSLSYSKWNRFFPNAVNCRSVILKMIGVIRGFKNARTATDNFR
jgi:hypothetical protein